MTSRLNEVSTSPKTSARDMKRDHELSTIAELEAGLVSLNEPQVSRFLHSHFLRVGLPILSGLLDDTFEPLRWEEFTGNQYVSVEIIDDSNGALLYSLPPLLRQAPTVINDDPNRESLTAESQHLLNIRDIDPTEASAQLLRVAEESFERQNGSLEYGSPETARSTIDVLNLIFSDSGLGQLVIPEGLGEIKTVTPVEEKAPTVAKAENYDFNQGEDL